jgi:hypothetical protein
MNPIAALFFIAFFFSPVIPPPVFLCLIITGILPFLSETPKLACLEAGSDYIGDGFYVLEKQRENKT